MDRPATPAIVLTEPARKILERHLADSPEAQFIRVHVGRSWGGFTYQLSLDGTVDAKDDVTVEADGLRFVVAARQRHLVPGLVIEVQRVFGREGLVAWNTAFEPGGC